MTCLENDGGVLAAALTACGIALATSGIETFDLVIGVNLRAHGDRVLMDPNFEEEDAAPSREGTYGNVTLGFMPVSVPASLGTKFKIPLLGPLVEAGKTFVSITRPSRSGFESDNGPPPNRRFRTSNASSTNLVAREGRSRGSDIISLSRMHSPECRDTLTVKMTGSNTLVF